MHSELRKAWDNPIAWRIVVGIKQLPIILNHRRWHLDNHLRKIVTLLRHHLAVGNSYDMQYHIIISWIGMVTMLIPVARILMYLHIAYPQRTCYFHLGIEKVGTRIAVVQSWV